MASRSTSVATTAIALPSPGGTYSPLPGRRRLYIKNTGAATAYIGGADVTTSNGYDLPTTAGANELILDVTDGLTIYATKWVIDDTQNLGVGMMKDLGELLSAQPLATDDRGYLLVSDAADCEMVTGAVTVGTSATPVPARSLPGRQTVLVFNFDALETIYIGGRNVSTSNGFPIAPQDFLQLSITDRIQLYAVSNISSHPLRVMELA